MNIDDMKLGDLKKIAAMFGGESQVPSSPHIGKFCLIRTYASGVHAGTLAAHHGRQVELKNSRRLWRWDVAPKGVSLSEVAIHGPIGDRSKVSDFLPDITLLDALEIIPCTAEAAARIAKAPVATP